MPREHSILIDIFLTILTGGLWNFWVQYRQIRDTNKLLPHEQQKNFIIFLLLVFITFGLYFFWHEYRLTKELHLLIYGDENIEIAILCGVASFFCLWFIVDSYQQNLINQYLIAQNS